MSIRNGLDIGSSRSAEAPASVVLEASLLTCQTKSYIQSFCLYSSFVSFLSVCFASEDACFCPDVGREPTPSAWVECGGDKRQKPCTYTTEAELPPSGYYKKTE